MFVLATVLIITLVISLFAAVFRQGEKTEAALTNLRLSELPAKAAKEAGHSTTVTAYDGGVVMTDYGGTIQFSATDHTVPTDSLPATLPADYTFKNGAKEKIMTINGWDATLVAHSYAAVANKLADNGVQNAYVGVFETTATGTQNGNLFIENDHSFDGGTTGSNYYDLADFITAATVRSIDVYAWITVFGPESTINVGGVTYKTWVDPASAEHQTYINNLITHLLTNYAGLKGIVIDYIRYADAGAAEKYRVYKDGGTYTDYTGNFAPVNATTIIHNAVESYKTTVAGFGKELAAEVYPASDDSTYNNWVKADLGQDYAMMAAHLDAILPMAYHVGWHGPQWVAEVVDYVCSKTHPVGSCFGVIPHVQTYQDGKDIEWPGPGEIAAATDPIDYAKVSGLAFYSYENTSDNEWVEVKDSFDDNGTKTFSNEIIFGSTGTYDLKVKDGAVVGTQAGIVVFDGHVSGSLVKTASASEVYFIQDGMKSWVITPTVLESRFKWNQIVMIGQTEMDNYVVHSSEPNLHYREGTIFKRADLPEVYVVENKQKRHIDSPETFAGKGYNWSNIVLAENQSVLDAHTDGVDLTGASALPNGAFIRTTSAPEVFMLESGSRRHIPSPAVFASQFRWQDVVMISIEAMNLYPIGSDCPFRAGTIIKDYDVGSIYFIEGEGKRHFTSPMFYEGLGYSWDDYATDDSTQVLDLYAGGNDMYQLPKYIDIIGDTRNGHTIHQTLTNLMTNDKPYLVFHVGDLVNTANSASDWATFDSITGNLRYNTRYYPALGNHEIASTYFEARFGTDKWYSLNIDNIHYIILDSNTSLASGSTQYTWLHADLDSASSARFILVFFHHPPYTAGGLADAVALFEAHGVDAVFNGHTHLYARKIALPGIGTYYLITGGGGAPLSSCPVAGYTNCSSGYEYVRMLLNNNQLELRVYNSSGTLIDTVDIPGV